MRGIVALIAVAMLSVSTGGMVGMTCNSFWWGLCAGVFVSGLCLLIDVMTKEK